MRRSTRATYLVEGTPIATERKVQGGIYATLTKAGHFPCDCRSCDPAKTSLES
ncbi:hypothetical protein AB0F17_11510 [Nonomuraea sp. NPDC026600]|uniref:hypothetical protein n=1 Tax=Nonomuraea sp. NPDC026600 TaxID=3155363 RepID=UPI0033ED6C9B